MKRRVGALLLALVLVMTGFAAYAEEGQPAELAVEDSVEDASVSEEEPAEGEDAPYEEEPAAAQEEPAEAAEPEAAPETPQSAEAEQEEQTTVSEETQNDEVTEPETPAPIDEETEEDIESYTAQKGSLSVTVEAPKGALPENVQLDMQIVDADSEEYEEVQSYVQEGKEEEEKEASNLEIADIYFILDGEKVDPSEPVTVKLSLTAANADSSSFKAWDYTDRTQGSLNSDTQEVEFITANPQTFAATWEDGDGAAIATYSAMPSDEEEESKSELNIDIIEISSPDDGEAYHEGEELTYQIKVENTSDDELSNIEVTYSPAENSEEKVWEIGDLGAGESDALTVTYFVNEDDIQDISNEYSSMALTATLCYKNGEEIIEAIYEILVNILSGPEISVDTNDDDSFEDDGKEVELGQKLKYKITYKNSGIDKKTVRITDTLEEGLDFYKADNNGKYDSETRTVTWTKSVEPEAEFSVILRAYVCKNDTGSVTNLAVVDTGHIQRSTNYVSNPIKDDNPRSLTKSAYIDDDTIDDDTLVAVGKELTYTIEYYNYHASSETVTITDELQEGLSYVANSASDGGDCKDGTITWKVSADPFEEGNVSFKAKVSGNQDKQLNNVALVTVGNDNPIETNQVTIKLKNDDPQTPIKSVDVKEDTGASIDGKLKYTISFYNNHYYGDTVTITDDLKGTGLSYVENSATNGECKNEKITWSVYVEPFSWEEVSFEAKVNDTVGEEIENKAIVKVGDEHDQETNLLKTKLKDDEPKGPSKSVSAGDGTTVSVGQELTYTIEYYNHHGTSQKVIITDELDKGLTFVSASDGGTYDQESRTITWEVDAARYQEGSVTFNAKVNGENLTTEVTGEEEKEEVEVKEDDDEEELEVDDELYYDTVTYGEIENTASVKIGDDEEEETKPVTNPVYSTSDSLGSGSGSDGEGSGVKSSVNTADDTPVAPMTVLFGTALVVLGADIIYRRRRTQR